MRNTLLWIATATVFLCSTPVHAQTTNDAATARSLFDRGVRALRADQHARAARYFNESLSLVAAAETACNLAVSYDRWTAHEEEAREAYLQCAELDQNGRFRGHALERAATLRAEIAARPEPTEPDEEPDAQPDPPEGGQRGTGPNPFTTGSTRMPAERGHGLLYVGIPVALIGAATLVAGALFAVSSVASADRIEEKYPGSVIAEGDLEYAAILENLNRDREIAIGLYIAGGAVAAIGVGLILADLLQTDESAPVLSMVPLEDGLIVQTRVAF